MDHFKEIVRFIRTLYNDQEGFIPLHVPVLSGNEKKYLEECIDTTFVSSVGKFVDQFESRVADYTGAGNAVACVNGTSALHLALRLAGVAPDTEVITQPLTFIATVNAISYCSAHPVFVDVDRDTLGLSPDSLRNWLNNKAVETFSGEEGSRGIINRKTGRRITACVPMHTFGHPCRIDEIVDICGEYNIPVVEDAAESMGSFYKERHTGTFGMIGVLSFNGNKVITTGGGGMLLMQDHTLATKARHLTMQAKVPHPWEFVHDEMGYNYRMPNINAAVGLAQLEQLPRFLNSKRDIAGQYEAFFSGIRKSGMTADDTNGVRFAAEPEHAKANYWLNAIQFPDRKTRDAFLAYSNDNGVMTRPVWTLMNKLKLFEQCESNPVPNAAELADTLVNIPSTVR